jgi:hypothetical protein
MSIPTSQAIQVLINKYISNTEGYKGNRYRAEQIQNF